MCRIMFVCHGNICRSAMAEAIAKDIIKKQQLQNEFYISSSSTSTEAVGEGVYPYADRTLIAHNIVGFTHISKQITKEDYENFDEIYVMDKRNLKNIKYIIPEDKNNKISLLLKDKEIEDPWYTRDFEKAFREIFKGVNDIINKKREA